MQIIVFLLFIVSFGFCIPQYTTEKEDWGMYSVEHFDWWSDNLMINDLMYHEHYNDHYAFMMNVMPSRLADSNDKTEWIPYDTYIRGEVFNVDLWEEYTGNIVIQRFLYYFFDKVLPCNGKEILIILRGINVILTATILMCIVNWIKKRNGNVIVLVIVLGMTFFIQCFAMFVKNLYWIPWTLLLPMAAMMVYMDSAKFRGDKRSILILFILAFVTCTLKQLCYFEFVPATMIAMTLPLFYIAIVNKYELRRFVQEFAIVFGGAVSSFIAVFGIKIILFCYRYGEKTGMQYLIEHMNKRLVEGSESAPGGIDAIRQAIEYLLRMPALSVRGVGRIDWGQMIIVCMVCIGSIFILNGAKWSRVSVELKAQIVTAVLSISAPLSWAVMAAPHTCIHYLHGSVMWFCGFYFFAMILILQTVVLVFSKMRTCYDKIVACNKQNV